MAVKIKGYATVVFRADLVRGNLPLGNFKENIYELKLDLFLARPGADELFSV